MRVQRGRLIGGRGGGNEGTRGSRACVERACFQCVESEAGARIWDRRRPVADLVRWHGALGTRGVFREKLHRVNGGLRIKMILKLLLKWA